MIGRIFKGLLWLLLLMLLVLVAAIAWLTATNSGLKQALELGQKFTPGELQWQSANGHLLGSLDLVKLSYVQADGLMLKFSGAKLDWSPRQLLSRKLKVDKLHVKDLEVHLPEPVPVDPAADQEPISLPNIRLPLTLEIGDLDLGQVRFYPHGAEQPILLERVSLAADAENEILQLLELRLKSLEAEVSISGTLTPIDTYPLDIDLTWSYTHPEFGPFSGNGQITGDLDKLGITHQLRGAVELQLDAIVTEVLTNPAWDATMSAQSISLGVFLADLQNTPLDARIQSLGSLDQFDITADITTDLQQTGPLNLNITANGDARKISIDKALVGLLTRPGEILLHGDIDIASQELDINGKWNALGWPLVGAPSQLESPAGTLGFQGSAKEFVAKVDAALQSDQFGRIDAKIDASGNDNKIRANEITLKSPDSDIRLDANGEFDLQAQRFDAKGQWTSLAWPLRGESIINSPEGSFSANGLVNDYKFKLTADLDGKDVPAGAWQLDGKGDDKRLESFKLSGKLLNGSLSATGKASWAPEIRWNIKFDGSQLDPGVQWPELPGKMNFAITSSGTIRNSVPELTVDIIDLSGTFRNQPLSGDGRIQLAGDELTISKLQLGNGKTRLTANGNFGEQWNLDWNIASPNLSSLLPELSGSIKGQGKLTGSREQPRAIADLKIKNLLHGENSIGMLDGNLDVDVSGDSSSQLTFTGSDLRIAGQLWDSLKLTGKGKPADHQLNLSLLGPMAHLKTGLVGGLKEQQWQGKLTELSANKTEFGDWTLKQPAPVTANADNVDLGDLCLLSNQTELCVGGDWSAAKGGRGTVVLSKLTPERFQKYLPSGMKLQTVLNGKAGGTLSSDGKTRATANFTLEPGSLTVNADTDPVDITLHKGTLDASLNGDRIDSVLSLDFADLGTLEAEAGVRNLAATPTLVGKLETELRDLTIISSFAPQLQAISGNLTSDLQISGTLDSPAVKGTLQLRDFSAEVPQVAIRLDDTNLSAESDGKGPMLFKGSSRSGGGTLSIDGQLDPKSRALKLKLAGNNFEVANSSHIQARITPDLNISMDDKGMKVDGKLVIPSAYINANGGNAGLETVSASGDVVIVEEEGAPEPAQSGSNMTLDVRIELGDDVKVEAGDFSGALKGNLQIEQTPELAPRGNGTIEVVNGDYIIYGQQLNMLRGKILFSGGPVDNPQLDMDVARNVEAYNVLAGAKIRGSAQSPQLQLYSEPSMPDASILSYMLLGQPPGTVGGSYTLGKYLTPDLYVGYGIGLFNAINTFNMRYKLTEKLAVHAASSNANSADLIYTIEK